MCDGDGASIGDWDAFHGGRGSGRRLRDSNPQVDLTKMKSISRTMPIYPTEAKAKKNSLNGPVVLAITIGKDGAVEAIHVKQSLREDYDISALNAVKTWSWEPYLQGGMPTVVDATVTVNYSAPHGKKKR